jgi:hypothetical protein
MGYVGNEPIELYVSKKKQSLTGNGTTGPYTLTNAVSNEQDLEVFVNNVRQEPVIAYTVSGTALTMTGNVASTDDFYVVYDGFAQGTVKPDDGSINTAQLANNSVSTAKLANGSVTQAKIASGVQLGAGYFLGENGTTGDTTNGLGDIFRVHEATLDTNVTIAANTNASANGPLTLNATLTINGALTIV